ncbi:MAG: serine hydrolase [Actinomycetota bacterium]
MSTDLLPLPGPTVGVSWPTDEWPRGADVDGVPGVADELFDPTREAELGRGLALVVVHRGRLVHERYGADTDADTTLISWSMAKTVTAMLVGIAVRDGLLDPSAPAPVPEWADDDRRAITLDDLLRMRSGLRFTEDYVDAETSDCIEMLFGGGRDDVGAYAVARPAAHRPGAVWSYSSGETNIICRILRDVLGGPDAVEAFARSELLDPIGATSMSLRTDAAGTFVGSSFAYATARDFARLGLLLLRDGVWDGRRVLPDGWVDAMRTTHATDPENGLGYGRQTWTVPDGRGTFRMNGYEGQRVICSPTTDTIVVRLGVTPIELAPAMDAVLERVLTLTEAV